MNTYHKIQSVYLRDPANKNKTFLDGEWTTSTLAMLGPMEIWQATEKVDGTNIRIGWDGERAVFGGRSDNAQIPAPLVERLIDLFPVEKMRAVFGDRGGVTLYGEGFGAKIQKGGGDYGEPNFILFDIQGGDVWFTRDNVETHAGLLGCGVVPLVDDGLLVTLDDAIETCRAGFKSQLRDTPPEGLVLRPHVELCDRMGRRVITKIKLKDFR